MLLWGLGVVRLLLDGGGNYRSRVEYSYTGLWGMLWYIDIGVIRWRCDIDSLRIYTSSHGTTSPGTCHVCTKKVHKESPDKGAVMLKLARPHNRPRLLRADR